MSSDANFAGICQVIEGDKRQLRLLAVCSCSSMTSPATVPPMLMADTKRAETQSIKKDNGFARDEGLSHCGRTTKDCVCELGFRY